MNTTDKYLAAATGGATYVKGNEAAERLGRRLGETGIEGEYKLFLDALAAERRATVERIRAVLKGRGFSPISEADMEWIGWRLDEEAAR